MTRTKEKIKTVVYKADQTVEHSTERMGTVYKKKDGREWAHHGKAYLQVVRDNGLAVIHAHHPENAQPVAVEVAAPPTEPPVQAPPATA